MIETMNRIEVISLFVEDLTAARRFYVDTLGLPVVFEDSASAVVKFENLMINLLQAAHAPELVELLRVAPPEAGSRFMLTILVEDVDAIFRQLSGRGVAFLNGPVDRAWGRRTAAFADPSGNVWEIAHKLAQ
jgi:catechol 2,3-dioxygenase-like lactoylglutathione lyase family enzyme